MKTDRVSLTMDKIDYLALPYSIIIRPADDGIFEAHIVGMSGCRAHGESVEEAVSNLREVQELWIEECLSSGRPIPLPEQDNDELPSGKWVQRVPRRLHLDLTRIAKEEGVSLNQLVTLMLSEATTAKAVQRVFDSIFGKGVKLSPRESDRASAFFHGNDNDDVWNIEKTFHSGPVSLETSFSKMKNLQKAHHDQTDAPWKSTCEEDSFEFCHR